MSHLHATLRRTKGKGVEVIQGGATAMLTDLYQLTMAQGYYDAGMGDVDACFHLFFRENPFGGGYSLACGLEQACDWLEDWSFESGDLAYLAQQKGNDGLPLFTTEFLERLGEMRFACDVDAVPEGTVVFPGEPLLRITGPLPQCQLVETALLTFINFQTLIATKAARCRVAAGDDPLVEFGLRRAQGPDGGVSASRAAYVGGCNGTSNVLAGQRFGIPVSGTHAHSWVMAFDSEIEAFEAYGQALPNNVTLLVDTYDTLEGVRRATAVGTQLRARGHRLAGIRIDSGDLAWLSQRAREILDDAGFEDTKIVASNELDEYLIQSLKDQGARIDVWGVGTKLATGWGQPALGGVFKLAAVKHPQGQWLPRIKVSEQSSKMTTPGVLSVRRYRRPDSTLAGDMIYDVRNEPPKEATMIDPSDSTRRKTFRDSHTYEELLVPAMRGERRVLAREPIDVVRQRAMKSLGELDPSMRRFLNPHRYPVGLEHGLYDLRTALVLRSKGMTAVDAIPNPHAFVQADAAIGQDGTNKE